MERLVLMHQLMMISAASPAALIVTPFSKPKVVSIAAATTRMGQDAMAEDDPEAVVSMAEADLSFSMAEADPSLEAEDDPEALVSMAEMKPGEHQAEDHAMAEAEADVKPLQLCA